MAPEEATLDDAMFSAAYDELRRLAHRLKKGSSNPTLNPTALVHEAYIKLAAAKRFHAESPQHLKYTVVRAMKHVLVDAARRQAAACRGGGEVPVRRVALDDASTQAAAFNPEDVLTVSFALDGLAHQSEPQARAFELQFFGGLEVAEIAELMGLSEKKAQRLLRVARASLALALAKGSKRSEQPT